MIPSQQKKPFFYLACLILGGCSIIPKPGEVPNRYLLEKVSITGEHHGISKKQLAIDVPVVFTPLDTNRVGLLFDTNQFDYYAGLEWSDRLSLLMRESLVYSLQDANLFAGVSRVSDGANPDLLLKIDVRKFYILKEGAINSPEIKACVEIYSTLIDTNTRHVLENRTFESIISLKDETKEGISEGLNEANKKTMIDLINWLSKFH